jgi:hypothetical protein
MENKRYRIKFETLDGVVVDELCCAPNRAIATQLLCNAIYLFRELMPNIEIIEESKQIVLLD